MTRLLVVDNEVLSLRALERVLPGYGFEVDCVETGAEALGLAFDSCFQVILLDRFLPGEDGLEVCESLRRLGYVGLIVMITGDGNRETELQALGLGADHFITKPLDLPMLVARIRAGLKRQSNHFVLTFGKLSIDVTAQVAYLEGKRIPLTELEIRMLCYLAVRAGEIVTWEKLVQGVWEQTHMSDLGTVRVRVAGLRQKLGGERERLETVRGVGLGFRG